MIQIKNYNPVVIPTTTTTTTTTTTGGADPVYAPQMTPSYIASNPYIINQTNLKDKKIVIPAEYKPTITSPLLLLGVAVVGGVLIYTAPSKTPVSTAYKTVATTGYKTAETAYKTVT